MSKEKLYCYLRVSTKGQVEDGSSIENQRYLGKRVSKNLGMEYVEMNEGGLSSVSKNRPKFEEIKEGILEGKIKHIWIYTRSRFSRDILEWLLLRKSLLVPNNVKMYEGQNGDLKSFIEPEDEVLDTVITTFQDFDRKLRRKVSIQGKRHLSISEGKNGVFMGDVEK
jgi:DNA invertase Pin-like site-specific DNA recombinase